MPVGRADGLLIRAKCAPHFRRVLYELDPGSPLLANYAHGSCPAGKYYCRITPTGDVTPCPYMPVSAGNLRETGFAELWEHAQVFTDLRHASLGGRCGACEFREICGGCRCRAYATYGDYLAEDPACGYQPGAHGGQLIRLGVEQTFGLEVRFALPWEPAAQARLDAIPAFARAMVVQAVEAYARSQGQGIVTPSAPRRGPQPLGHLAGAALHAGIRATPGGRRRVRPGPMATRDERYRQAAWTYVVYGVVYWLGGLALAAAGRGPRGMERGRWAWFVVGALFVVVIPWLLAREVAVARVCARFAGVLTLLVAYRAFEVARIAVRSRAATPCPRSGSTCPCSVGAWAFCLLTVGTAAHARRARPGAGRRERVAIRASRARRASAVRPTTSGARRSRRPGEVRWTPEAEARVARAPMFLRGMVRRLAEKRARAEGVTVITPELMTRYKSEMMGLAASGGYQVPPAAVPWTPEAEALLDAVPPFMRPMTRRICEELAAEHGAPAVTPALIREAEAEAETEAAATPLPWTPEAEARLVSRLGKAPAMMADFVLRLFQRDVEVEARRAGLDRITEEVVDQLWRAAPEAPVRWAPEAWARLQTAPEFVREGIRKAAERRARRMGVAEITSPLLTRFRNQAMMKAVKRIRELGFTELTFDAFDAAKAEIRTVSLNPEAQERLDRIRRYFETERHGQSGDFLGEDLMRRFRAHLRDPAAAPLDTSDEGPGT